MADADGFRPGLCSITFREVTADDLIRMSEAAGVRGIEWGSDVHVPVGDMGIARSVGARCEDSGIACPSYGSYVRVGAEDERQDFQAVLDTGLELGVSNIRVWAGSLPSTEVDGDRRHHTAETLHRYALLAAASGVTVSLEYHRNTLTDGIASAMALLKAADHPNLFSYWQPEPEISMEEWKDEISRLGTRCSHVHAFHWLPGRIRRPMAEGREIWVELFAALSAARGWDRTRYAFLEHVQDEDVGRFGPDFRVLKELCASP